MANDNDKTVGFVKYVVYVLLAIITIVSGYQMSVMAELPDKYVRKDTYKYEREHIDKNLDTIQRKLDGISEQIMKFHTRQPNP